ncbi:MAG: hypothetical protein AAGN66_07355 [Acidobacteriota bacterium]
MTRPIQIPVGHLCRSIALALVLVLGSACGDGPPYASVRSDDWRQLADRLPTDTGGEMRAVPGDRIPEAANGFFLYAPAGHEEADSRYPLLIFFHGKGEIGDSVSDTGELERVASLGPPGLIRNGTWDPPVPFFVFAPQAHPETYWEHVPDLIQVLLDSYPIDRSRIYMTGLSMGGYSTWWTQGTLGDHSQVAAAVPICGGLDERRLTLDAAAENLTSVPTWAFHGGRDTVVPPGESIRIVQRVNALSPEVPVRLTLFPHLPHDSWTAVYSSDLGTPTDPAWDPFDTDIYSWMLQYRRVSRR